MVKRDVARNLDPKLVLAPKKSQHIRVEDVEQLPHLGPRGIHDPILDGCLVATPDHRAEVVDIATLILQRVQ